MITGFPVSSKKTGYIFYVHLKNKDPKILGTCTTGVFYTLKPEAFCTLKPEAKTLKHGTRVLLSYLDKSLGFRGSIFKGLGFRVQGNLRSCGARLSNHSDTHSS